MEGSFRNAACTARRPSRKMTLSYIVQLCTVAALHLADIVTSWLMEWWYWKPDRLPPLTNPLLTESATQLAAKIRSGEVRSEVVVQAYIDRIKDVQPVLNAVVDQRFEEALEEARLVDELVASGEQSVEEWAAEKPFLGVPFTCKEAVAMEGLSFTSGVVYRKGEKAPENAEVVAELKKAGAIALAVTNVPELTYWWETNNNIYGRTRNPYHPSRIPGGSSGGEGALICSAGSVIGVGTDVAGSIRLPAFFCGIFGHKPSTGVVSNNGHFPKTEGVEHIYTSTGPMCRYATDLLPLMKVMATSSRHKLQLDSQVEIRNIKVYYMEDDGGNPYTSPVDTDQKNALIMVVHELQKNGVNPENLFLKEFHASFHMWYYKIIEAGGPSFASLMTGGEKEISFPLEFIKLLLGCSEHTTHALFYALYTKLNPAVNSSECQSYVDMCDVLKKDLQEILGEDGVFLYPSQPSHLYLNQTMHRIQNLGYTSIFNVMGFPSTQCPLGLDRNGLPLGIQVVSNLNNDHLSIAVAVELEKLFGGWVNPSPVLHE